MLLEYSLTFLILIPIYELTLSIMMIQNKRNDPMELIRYHIDWYNQNSSIDG